MTDNNFELESSTGIRLPERRILIPRSISREAQASLSRMVGPDGIPLNAKHSMPDLGDYQGWVDLKRAVDRYYASAAPTIAGSGGLTIETVTIDSATVYVATPAEVRDARHVLVDLHGGAFVFGGGKACMAEAHIQANRHGICCYGVDYRTPPDHPYPAALNDCLAVYRAILNQYGPENIAISGRSAGGNLAVATMLRARDEGLPFPAALILLSPEIDLTESGDSFQTNQLIDPVLPYPLIHTNLLYAGGADLQDPYLSPLFGSFDGFPPTLLQTGTRDLFLSNAARLHRKLLQAGVDVEFHIFEAMPHGGFGGVTPEDEELTSATTDFLKTVFSGAIGLV